MFAFSAEGRVMPTLLDPIERLRVKGQGTQQSRRLPFRT
jgi:hypothetical protein